AISRHMLQLAATTQPVVGTGRLHSLGRSLNHLIHHSFRISAMLADKTGCHPLSCQSIRNKQGLALPLGYTPAIVTQAVDYTLPDRKSTRLNSSHVQSS